jgi:hypothetical protein
LAALQRVLALNENRSADATERMLDEIDKISLIVAAQD